MSPGCSRPNTSTRFPSLMPRRTFTHSALPSLTLMTKIRSVVALMADDGTNKLSAPRRIGQATSAYIPGVSLLPEFVTSNSTGMVRVFESTA